MLLYTIFAVSFMDMQPQQVLFIYHVTYAEDASFLDAYRQRVDQERTVPLNAFFFCD